MAAPVDADDDIIDPAEHSGWLARAEVRAWIDQTANRLVVPRERIEEVVAQARLVPEVKRLIAPPPAPSRPRTWTGYRARFLDPLRVSGGVNFWNTHADALDRASARWGVPQEIIVAIAGVETVYGRVQGNFRVVDALATLGFDWPADAPRDRSAYFREQLAQFIALTWERDIDPYAVRGSYAGAIGVPQFMPESIRRFAVDFDEDGRIDLHDDPVDAIGSIANFLAQHGWRRDVPVALPARVPNDGFAGYIAHDLTARYSAAEFESAGIGCASSPTLVRTAGTDDAVAAPLGMADAAAPPPVHFGLVDLETPDAPTEYRCATENFFAITQYNRTFFYAASVMDLAATLRQARTSGLPRKTRKRRVG